MTYEGALINAVAHGDALCVKQLLPKVQDRNFNDSYLLYLAAQLGFGDIVEILLAGGVSPTARDSQALRLASRVGHTEIVSLLLDKGADPSARDNEAYQAALARGHQAVVDLLRAKMKPVPPPAVSAPQLTLR